MNRIDLDGRIAIVTGAARGIGRAIAERVSASGAKVAIWDVDGAVAAATALAVDNATYDIVDVTDPAGIARAVEATEARLGPPDILVNNAGISGPNLPISEYPPEEWRRVVEIDLIGVFNCCRAVLPLMQRRDYGRIVNIASIAGKEGNPNASAYSAAKAGVIGLTKSLGKELAGTGIRVNCVTPAAARTDIFAQMTEAQIDYMLSKIPMGRFVLVEEIAALVAWLASEECSFSTGGVFDISGGRATYWRCPAMAAARSARRRTVAQSPAATAALGAIHDPPTIGTLGNAKYLAAERSSMPPVGQNAIPGKTGASACNSASPPTASAGNSFRKLMPRSRAVMISEGVATPGR
jgi:2-dehydro-3-deoxy-L-rhamnonate dehydrogenase (NAD+)